MSIGLFFNGFLKEIKTAADRAVTGVTTAGGSVKRPVALVAVVAVVAGSFSLDSSFVATSYTVVYKLIGIKGLHYTSL